MKPAVSVEEEAGSKARGRAASKVAMEALRRAPASEVRVVARRVGK